MHEIADVRKEVRAYWEARWGKLAETLEGAKQTSFEQSSLKYLKIREGLMVTTRLAQIIFPKGKMNLRGSIDVDNVAERRGMARIIRIERESVRKNFLASLDDSHVS